MGRGGDKKIKKTVASTKQISHSSVIKEFSLTSMTQTFCAASHFNPYLLGSHIFAASPTC